MSVPPSKKMKTLKGGEWVKQWVIVKGVFSQKATMKMKAMIMKLAMKVLIKV